MSGPDDLGTETRPQRFARAQRDGEVFERCRFGDRVSTCYHSPRCLPEVPGFGRYVPGPDDMDGGVDLCHICGDESDGLCVICDRPVCDNHAGSRAYDRWCRDHEWRPKGGA